MICNLLKKTLVFLVLIISFLASCSEMNEQPDGFLRESLNVVSNPFISDNFKNPNLTSVYNTQEHFGYWYDDFINMIAGNYSSYIVLDSSNRIDVELTSGQLSVALSSFYTARLGINIDVDTVQNQMQEVLERILNGFDSTTNISDFDLTGKSGLYIGLLSKIIDVANLENVPLIVTSHNLIDSIKSIETEIYYTPLPIEDKEFLYQITAMVKYSANFAACITNPATSPKGKEVFLAYQCCCGSGCYCLNAIYEMTNGMIVPALLGAATTGGKGGAIGIIVGGVMGATGGVIDYILRKEGLWPYN